MCWARYSCFKWSKIRAVTVATSVLDVVKILHKDQNIYVLQKCWLSMMKTKTMFLELTNLMQQLLMKKYSPRSVRDLAKHSNIFWGFYKYFQISVLTTITCQKPIRHIWTWTGDVHPSCDLEIFNIADELINRYGSCNDD